MPSGGFCNLLANKFTITLIEGRVDGLPTAHTCFNRLEFPDVNQMDNLADLLNLAINHCESFDIE